jgi:arabinogalactan endo-1,4-beta-galactosidase
VLSRREVLLGVPAAVVISSVAMSAPANAAGTAQAAGPAIQPAVRSRALRIRGGDLSFTLQEYLAGIRYSDRGQVRPVEEILARHGANYSRLRLWVDPPAGYSDLQTTTEMARRARRAGLKVLLDLHYSDFWADPGHQTTPAAWAGQDLATLAETVREYTRRTLRHFADAGVPVDMVQIGNEITSGMLWPVGQLYTDDGVQHWPEFTTLLKAGIQGAREASTRRDPITVMVHIDRGGDNGGSVWFFDHILAAGVEFDVIGESYYPFWHGSLAALQANLNDLAVRYGKDLIVAETAYPWTLGNGDDLANSFADAATLPDGDRFPPTPQGQAGYFEALRAVLLQVPGQRGAGFLDWEPEWIPGVGWEPGAGNPNDNLTMFDWSGAALPSLEAFRPA